MQNKNLFDCSTTSQYCFIQNLINTIYSLFINIIPFLIFGFFLGKKNPKISKHIARPLIRFGIPLSVMGLLLKEGIDINLIKSAFLAFFLIGFLIVLINTVPIFKNRLPDYTFQLAGLIGNTSFLGIPIAIALLPSTTINFTICLLYTSPSPLDQA